MSFIINPFAFGAAGPTSPDQLAGLVRWYKADSYALLDNDTIGGAGREWIDQSASGEDAVQASAPSRPFYRTNIFGAMPAIQFVSANTTFLTMTPISITSNFTIIVIGKVSIPSVALSSFISAVIHCSIYIGSANSINFASGTGGATSDVFAVSQASVRQMAWRRNTGGLVSFREQNISRGTVVDSAGDASFSMDLIGADINANYASAHYGEICVYDQNHSDFNLDSLFTSYFQPRWGLP